VTDLVLIYESYFFNFPCPLVNTPQLNTELFLRLNYDWIVLLCTAPYIVHRQPWRMSVACRRGKVLTEPLPINGLQRLFVAAGTCVWRVAGYQWTSVLAPLFRLSGVMSQYYVPIKLSSYLPGNPLLLHYKDQSVNAVQGNTISLFREACGIQVTALCGEKCRIVFVLKHMVHIRTIVLQGVVRKCGNRFCACFPRKLRMLDKSGLCNMIRGLAPSGAEYHVCLNDYPSGEMK
jgi:hypothetical protein